jgi:DNA-binding FrmR family transcriptional regulator
MNADRRNRLKKVRRQLDAIKREIESLKAEGGEAFVSDLERAVSSIEEALRKIDLTVWSDEATEPVDVAQVTFETWLKEEMRGGVLYMYCGRLQPRTKRPATSG